MLQGGVAPDAVALWRSAFAGLAANGPDASGMWALALGDQTFTLLDSPPIHDFGPTPSWSFMVDLDTAEDVDRAADNLGQAGRVMMPADAYDFAQRFAWVEDRFGISWQLRFGAV
ncbi:3-demethylubiquinone-9 3-methyltransferase [Pseudooctadecabacter jejudonensis]|uniref:3-demethylubiquinone-9 3-methyltransferase n=2 Tax=Pseudooctadecabacter jejudonensis TaxID=1391910 RepID=A0A1Y5R7Y9_9RHOB|nr:3-demethylubiquinone-9 3-methyltransferase [Pseudooctadecabacter jejudonensis]